jgi:hypothetical protein
MPFLSVTPYKIVCRDKETVEGKDHFAMAGAVIVDGQVTPFIMPDRSMTNGQIESFGWPSVAYSGFSTTMRIGLAVLAWDIDDNDRWARAREDAKAVSEIAAKLAEHVPVVGDIAAAVLEHWPYVVDIFVGLDQDDQLIKWSGYIDLHVPPPNTTSSRVYEIRSRREDPTGHSSWDYSVFIDVSVCNPQPFTSDSSPVRTLEPKSKTAPKTWIGQWEADSLTVTISRVPDSLALLNVTTRWKSGQESTTQTSYISVPELNEFVPQPEIAPQPLTRQQALLISMGQNQAVVIDRKRSGWVAIPPVGRPRTSGGDVLYLEDGAVLEMFEVLVNGDPSNIQEIRYFRPPQSGSLAFAFPVDEMAGRAVV